MHIDVQTYYLFGASQAMSGTKRGADRRRVGTVDCGNAHTNTMYIRGNSIWSL